MPEGATLRLLGYREFMAATALAPKESKKYVRTVFAHVGQSVKGDAQSSVRPVDSRSAAGYRVVVRQTGVAVEQSLRRTTGQHSEWGSWQMRHALVPALEANEERTVLELDRALSLV